MNGGHTTTSTSLVVLVVEPVRQLLHDLDRVEVVVVHLPVARDDRLALAAITVHSPIPGSPRSACKPGEVAVLDELERRAATGADVVDAIGEADLADRGRAVAAADDGETATVGDRLGDAYACPAANGASSNTPIGPFHNTVRGAAISSA